MMYKLEVQPQCCSYAEPQAPQNCDCFANFNSVPTMSCKLCNPWCESVSWQAITMNYANCKKQLQQTMWGMRAATTDSGWL